jgi:2-phospho-L-lactate/phosphoenolpyruvate guanylyltransferase
VLIPVKAFDRAKARLAPALDEHRRADLAKAMATGVVRAAHDLPVTVACDDDGVAEWAGTVGAAVVWTLGLDLNGAVTAGVDELTRLGTTRVVIAHADLPDAVDLRPTLPTDPSSTMVTAVPDQRDDGTNVLTVPTGTGFLFAYGPRSFAKHRTEAARLGLDFHSRRLADLMRDVDEPRDLTEAERDG